MASRVCRDCGIEKPEAEFARNRKTRLSSCRACRSIVSKKWYAANSANVRANRRDKYWRNPEYEREYARRWAEQHREEDRIKARRWYRDNKVRALEKNRKYRKANPEKIKILKRRDYEKRKQTIRAKNDAWIKANPDKNRLIRQGIKGRRRARIKANGFEKFSLKEILIRDGYRCHLCGGSVKPKEVSFDHLIPISKGGSHTKKNVAVAHLRCNLERGAGKIPAQLRLLG